MPLPAGYRRLPLSQFNLQKYLGTWHQYGSIRPWWQPNATNVILTCTASPRSLGEYNLDVRLEHLIFKHHLEAQIVLGDVLPNFTVNAPRALLGFGLKTDFVVVAGVIDPRGEYAYLLCERKGTPAIHVLARTRDVPPEHVTYLREVLVELGWDLSRFQLS